MEINKEEGNTIQINKPELRLKPPKNGMAERVLQRHLNLHRLLNVTVKVCSCVISKQCKSCSSSPPSYQSTSNSNFYYGSRETYEFFTTTNTLKREEKQII